MVIKKTVMKLIITVLFFIYMDYFYSFITANYIMFFFFI